jgi:hypothetical protein
VDLLLRRARLDDSGALLDIGIADGRIADLRETLPQGAPTTIDVGGRVVIPGLGEPRPVPTSRELDRGDARPGKVQAAPQAKQQ